LELIARLESRFLIIGLVLLDPVHALLVPLLCLIFYPFAAAVDFICGTVGVAPTIRHGAKSTSTFAHGAIMTRSLSTILAAVGYLLCLTGTSKGDLLFENPLTSSHGGNNFNTGSLPEKTGNIAAENFFLSGAALIDVSVAAGNGSTLAAAGDQAIAR
jgi:hypothetical protein